MTVSILFFLSNVSFFKSKRSTQNHLARRCSSFHFPVSLRRCLISSLTCSFDTLSLAFSLSLTRLQQQAIMTFARFSVLAAVAVMTAGGAVAFTPAIPLQHQQHAAARSSPSSSSSSSSSTRLYISSYKGVSSTTSSFAFGGATSIGTLDKGNPENQVQNYLKEPAAVEARSNLDGCILVSGLVNSKDNAQRTDQFLFDLLNNQDSAFEFTKIVALVNDEKRAKKRLLSRSARYTGLLDKLQVVAAASENALPTLEQLEGVKSWLAYIDKSTLPVGVGLLEQCQAVAERAQAAPSVENVAILLTQANNLDAASCQAVVDLLKRDDSKTVYTIVAVGEIQDNVPEGRHAYQFEPFGSENGTLPDTAVFSRDESYRMICELLQLAAGKNTAYSFAEVYNVNVTAVRLIKGLREAGYARPQEIDYMIRGGVQVRVFQIYRLYFVVFMRERERRYKVLLHSVFEFLFSHTHTQFVALVASFSLSLVALYFFIFLVYSCL
jgi:hypothetical protein